MARCTKCHSKWKARNVWGLILTDEGKPCHQCNTIHHLAFKDKGTLLWLSFIFEICFLIFIILFPFIAKLSIRKKD